MLRWLTTIARCKPVPSHNTQHKQKESEMVETVNTYGLAAQVERFLTAKEAVSFLSREIKKLRLLQRVAQSTMQDAEYEMIALVDYRESTQGGFGVDDCIELYGREAYQSDCSYINR
jgi:hypothetical protein